LSEVAEDSMLQCMGSTPPVVIDFDDLIVDPYESKEEYEKKLRQIMNNWLSFWLNQSLQFVDASSFE
jgi:hypothetical protein